MEYSKLCDAFKKEEVDKAIKEMEKGYSEDSLIDLLIKKELIEMEKTRKEKV